MAKDKNYPMMATMIVNSKEHHEQMQKLVDRNSEVMGELKFRPHDVNEQARILIAGETILTSSKEKVMERFGQEVAMNNNIRIAAQEKVNGEWVTFKGRKRQKQQVI